MEPLTTPDKTLRALSLLEKAMIDTSSILYIQKAGYFDVLLSAIQLYSIPEVISEIKSRVSGLTIIRISETLSSLPTDRKLVACAIENKLAMISEDHGILKAMHRAKAPYFNALMMLNFLLLVNRINEDSYRRYFSELKNIAWYSEAVWAFGETIYTAVIRN
jgi:hypothetical protein